MAYSNKAMLAMQRFCIQLNKNSFGLVATQPLNIPLLNAGETLDISLSNNCTGSVQKTETAFDGSILGVFLLCLWFRLERLVLM